MRRIVPALALATLGAMGAVPAQADAVSRGKAIATRTCAPCHAVGPTGESPNPKAPPFRTLGERYPVDALQEALTEGISVGHEGLEMPEFSFSPRQADDLIAYLKKLNNQ